MRDLFSSLSNRGVSLRPGVSYSVFSTTFLKVVPWNDTNCRLDAVVLLSYQLVIKGVMEHEDYELGHGACNWGMACYRFQGPNVLLPLPLCHRERRHSSPSIEVQLLPFCELQNKFVLLPSTVRSGSIMFVLKLLPVVFPVSVLVCSKSKHTDLGNQSRSCSLS